jgi:hypothetical protein
MSLSPTRTGRGADIFLDASYSPYLNTSNTTAED